MKNLKYSVVLFCNNKKIKTRILKETSSNIFRRGGADKLLIVNSKNSDFIGKNLLELSELLLDEKKAEEYLLKVGILKTFTECEKCGSNRITKISRGRHRCSNCESEWSMKKGSVLYNNKLSYSKFIGIVKLFELGNHGRCQQKQWGLSLKI